MLYKPHDKTTQRTEGVDDGSDDLGWIGSQRPAFECQIGESVDDALDNREQHREEPVRELPVAAAVLLVVGFGTVRPAPALEEASQKLVDVAPVFLENLLQLRQQMGMVIQKFFRLLLSFPLQQ